MTDFSAGNAFLDILPSLRGFSRQLQRELRGINVVYDLLVRPELDRSQTDRVQTQLRQALRALPVSIDVDDRELNGIRARIERLSGQQIGVTISGDQAQAEVAAIERDLQRLAASHPDVSVRVDARQARTEMAAVSAEVSRLDGRTVRLDVDARDAAARAIRLRAVLLNVVEHKYDLTINANTAGAVASVATLIAKVAMLGGMTGVVGGFGGALAGLGAAGAVAGAGAASSLLAFVGVGDALTAMGAQQDAAATTARSSAKQQTAAAYAVAGAQDRVKQASQDASRARVEGARSVSDAEKTAGKQVEQALTAQAAAQKQLRQATTDLRREQDTLTDAWEAGRRSLEDLQSQVSGNRLDQRQAALDLRDAEKELAAARQSGDQNAIDRATLAYDRQVQTVKDLQTQGARLASDNADAQKKGVAGSDQVVAANERIATAQDRVVDATKAAKDADAAVVAARVDGAESVARAREQADQRVADSNHQVIEAQRALTQALAQTGDAGAASADKVATAMANLSPAGRDFVTFLFGAKQQMQALSGVAQTALFPPLQAGLQALLNQGPAISGMVATLAGSTGGALQTVLTTLADPTWMTFFGVLADASTTIMPALAQLFLHGADAARELLLMLLPLAPAGIALANQFISLFQVLAPFIVALLQGLIPAASLFLAALAPLGPVLAALQPILLVLAQVLAQVLLAALQALAPILVALTPLIQAFAVQWAQGLVNALTAATPLLLTIFGFLSDHADTVVTITTVVAGLVGGLGPLSWALGGILTLLHGWILWRLISTVLAGFGLQGTLVARVLELFLHPLGLIRILLPLIGQALSFLVRALITSLGPFGAVLAILGYLFTSNEQFRTAVMGLVGVLGQLIGQIVTALQPAMTAIMGVVQILGNVFGALASGLATALVPVITALADIIQWLSPVLAPLAAIILGIRAAVIAWQVAQWLLNVALDANPITLIVIALAALVGGLVWAYQNVGWFRDAVDAAFAFIGAAASWLWDNALKPVVDAIVAGAQWVGSAFSWLWTNVLSPVFGFIGAAAKLLAEVVLVLLVAPLILAWEGLAAATTWLWESVIKPVFDAIGAAATWLWENSIKPGIDAWVWVYQNVLAPVITWLWENIIRPVFDAIGVAAGWLWNNALGPAFGQIGDGFRALGDVFVWIFDTVLKPAFDGFKTFVGDIVTGLGIIWDGLKAAFTAPVKFVLDVVWNNGIGWLWDKAKGIGIPLPDFPRVDTSRFADGGWVPGYAPGRDTVMAMVSPGEGWVRPEVGAARGGRQFIDQVNAVAKKGGTRAVEDFLNYGGEGIQQFADGGIVSNGQRWVRGEVGKPYVWGGVGPGGYDCTGLLSALTNVLRGDAPNRRLFATGSFGPNRGAGGFLPGIEGSAFSIGVSPNTGGGVGHAAGTLGGMNVESRGGRGVLAGPSARGADAGLFPWKFHLPLVGGRFVSGGAGPGIGGSNAIADWFQSQMRSVFDDGVGFIRNNIMAPAIGPPGGSMLHDLPYSFFDGMTGSIRDFLFGKAQEADAAAGATSGLGGVTQWTGLVQQALTMMGLSPTALTDTVLRRMNQESGGNPRAINNWDSNAKRGDPSKGLMQVIGCVPHSTKILTRRGWLRHDEVQVGDETLGYNPETGRTEWTQVTHVHHYQDRQVRRIGNDGWHADVTDEHRWWSDSRRRVPTGGNTSCPTCDREFASARGLQVHSNKAHGEARPPERRQQFHYVGEFVRTKDLNGNHRLRVAAAASTDGIPGLSLQDVRVLAWLAGDGHIERVRAKPVVCPECGWLPGTGRKPGRGPLKQPANSVAVHRAHVHGVSRHEAIADGDGGFDGSIYQAKPEMVVKLRALLADVPHSEYTRGQRQEHHLPAFEFKLRREYITDLLKRSEVLDTGHEAFVLRLCAEQRAAWLDSMIDAEGNRQRRDQWTEFVRITQRDGALQNAIKLAVYLEGYRPSTSRLVRKDGAHHQPAAHIGLCQPHVAPAMFHEPQDLDVQDVWCVETELGTWTMEQDGQVMLTGNSTFEHYRDPRALNNIWDPLANILASMHYAIARYGSLPAAYNKKGGYDAGGLASGIGWLWKGTGLDERVLPPEETQAYPTLTRLSQQLEAGRLPVPTGVSDRQYAAALSGARGGDGQRGGDTFHLHGLDHYTPQRVAREVQRVRDFDDRLS